MVASHLDRIVYLNGDFIEARNAKLSIFDRGLLFADAVYEGMGVLNGHIIDFDMHYKRLKSLSGGAIDPGAFDVKLTFVQCSID